ncbi:MAG: integrating conjugative element protein [gamma proteobacterium endosymbiont of Lamellibrachia anaximandri]|nr:integrating conjugative element protein [gamma proteobacterium endosymbiont of Lamellibrachia anaximandri]MBL3535616.1 integrating conjugative element protein [gamma proteobacterium endosymbiont of Lamellibrachia anaximandri]
MDSCVTEPSVLFRLDILALLLFTLGILSSHLIQASPVVIHDAGGEPLAPYIQRMFEEEPSAETERNKRTPTQGNAGQTFAPFTLPITTPEMSPGRVTLRPIDQPFMSRPLFLIGSDRVSRQWFIQNRERLSQLNAAGMLVQVDSIKDLRTMARLSEGFNLQIMPASGSDIAHELGLKHYPVLIWKSGIEQ